MHRLYHYVGPKGIASKARAASPGFRIEQANDVMRWLRETRQELNAANEVTATFIVDEAGFLRIADRRSEHTACAGGKTVQTAGEITFRFSSGIPSVVAVTNQSTGYCPEPGSFPALAEALKRVGTDCPPAFSTAFQFRLCENCRSINIVKDDVFECAVCSLPLPLQWNFSTANTKVKQQGA